MNAKLPCEPRENGMETQKLSSNASIQKIVKDDPSIREACERSALASELLNQELTTGEVTREQLIEEGALTPLSDIEVEDGSETETENKVQPR